MAKKTPSEIPGDKSFMERLKELPKITWIIALLAALAIMVGPIIYDFCMEEGDINSNGGSGKIVIQDYAGLLTAEEQEALKGHMNPITQYGGVGFVTVSEYHAGTAAKYAEKKYREYFGTSSGTVFLIDMSTRKIWIFSDGKIYSTVTTAKAETITDNVYKLASRAQYYDCAAKTFDQIAQILQGGVIPQPMKHASNALISFAIALVLVFIIANSRTRIRHSAEEDIIRETSNNTVELAKASEKTLIDEKKVRHVESSGGGGGGFGGGGGGGGSSGGGGGHGF